MKPVFSWPEPASELSRRYSLPGDSNALVGDFNGDSDGRRYSRYWRKLPKICRSLLLSFKYSIRWYEHCSSATARGHLEKERFSKLNTIRWFFIVHGCFCYFFRNFIFHFFHKQCDLFSPGFCRCLFDILCFIQGLVDMCLIFCVLSRV